MSGRLVPSPDGEASDRVLAEGGADGGPAPAAAAEVIEQRPQEEDAADDEPQDVGIPPGGERERVGVNVGLRGGCMREGEGERVQRGRVVEQVD